MGSGGMTQSIASIVPAFVLGLRPNLITRASSFYYPFPMPLTLYKFLGWIKSLPGGEDETLLMQNLILW